MGPKYEFTGVTMSHEGHLLHRIRRLSDGKIGGWIEKEDNLSQENDCWVGDNAMIYDDAQVSYKAQVYGEAKVFGKARVHCNAEVYDNAIICDNVEIDGEAKIFGTAKVYEHAKVDYFAKVYDNARIFGNAKISENAHIFGNAQIYDYAVIDGRAKIYDDAKVYEHCHVKDAKVYGNSDNWCYDLWGKDSEMSGDEVNKETVKVVQDFIYKINDSDKLEVLTDHSSLDIFFSKRNIYHYEIDEPDTLVIRTTDTKIELFRIEKYLKDRHSTGEKIAFRFIVNITTEDGETFNTKFNLVTQEQLNNALKKTIEALKIYPQFCKYADNLEECL